MSYNYEKLEQDVSGLVDEYGYTEAVTLQQAFESKGLSVDKGEFLQNVFRELPVLLDNAVIDELQFIDVIIEQEGTDRDSLLCVVRGRQKLYVCVVFRGKDGRIDEIVSCNPVPGIGVFADF